MKQFIKEWGIVFVIAMLLGGMVGTALADNSGDIQVTPDAGRAMVWNAMTAISNTDGIFNKKGISEHAFVLFSNSSSEIVDMWLQHSPDNVTFANAISTAIVFNPADSDSFIWQGDIDLLPYLRWHTEDSDITANNVTATTWAWR